MGQGVVKHEEGKPDKIRDTPRPTTKRHIRAFLGLARFYLKFIPHFAEIAVPLTDATKSSQPNTVVWNDQRKRAVQMLKDGLCSQPVCCLPDFKRKFMLRTDASDMGIGAVLLQDQSMGLQPIAYASNKLIPAEKHYH